MISTEQRPLPAQHTTNTRDVYPCPKRGSNPPSQHSIGRRFKLQSTRPTGSVKIYVHNRNMTCNDNPSPDAVCRQLTKCDRYRKHVRKHLMTQPQETLVETHQTKSTFPILQEKLHTCKQELTQNVSAHQYVNMFNYIRYKHEVTSGSLVPT